MENQRLVSKNNSLEQIRIRLENTVQELSIKVRSIHTFESEIHQLQQERDEFERRINTYLTERSSFILEIEKLKILESRSYIDLESKLKTLATENERLSVIIDSQQSDLSESHLFKLKIQEMEDKIRMLASENERLQFVIREKDVSTNALQKARQSIEGDLENLLKENKRVSRELKQREVDIEDTRNNQRVNEQKLRLEYEARITEVYSENKRIVDKYNQLCGEYELSRNKISQFEIDMSSLEDKINQLNHELKLRDIAINDKSKRLQEIEGEKSSLQKKVEKNEKNTFELRQEHESKYWFAKSNLRCHWQK